MSDLESESADPLVPDDVVPDDVIPHGKLPPLRYRDLPEPQPLRKMIGPGIVLAGLALGSGEFVLWPYITYRSGFVFFWACILGVTTQYFLNMEITRWTLATGESAITGFCRLSRRWAFIFLALNIIPWMLPAWAKGAARLIGWLIWGPDQLSDGMVTALAIAGLLLCGAVLTMGPVIYETVERIQLFLVTLVLVLVVIIAVLIVRTDAIVAQCQGLVSFGLPERDDNLTLAALLGAIAFAGVGGTLNLGQSNYIKDKGFGMGHYIGRITSPVTGRAEPMSEVGFHFPDTPENRQRWQRWWRAASLEHFISFYCTCLICLILLTLINYSVFYQPDGKLREGLAGYANNLDFIWAEAIQLGQRTVLGSTGTLLFLIAGVAILLTTEIGVLDGISRIGSDIVKVNWLLDSSRWTESRLYYLFLWSVIGLGVFILGFGTEAFQLVKYSAAMNGCVMFLYSITLLQLNLRALPRPLRISWWRVLILIWSVIFFGTFTVWVGWSLAGF